MSHKHHRNVRWTTRTVYFYSAQKQLRFAALWSSFAPPFSVYEIDEADGKTFIAMALVEGESLAATSFGLCLYPPAAMGLGISGSLGPRCAPVSTVNDFVAVPSLSLLIPFIEKEVKVTGVVIEKNGMKAIMMEKVEAADED